MKVRSFLEMDGFLIMTHNEESHEESLRSDNKSIQTVLTEAWLDQDRQPAGEGGISWKRHGLTD